MIINHLKIRHMIGLDGNRIVIDIHEALVPKKAWPNFVEILHESKVLISTHIKLNITTGICEFDVESKSDLMRKIFLSDDSYIPFTFKFIRRVNMQQAKNANVVGKASLIVVGYVCKLGFLCGYIKKFGIRARDEFIQDVDLKRMHYFAFHNGTSGRRPIIKQLDILNNLDFTCFAAKSESMAYKMLFGNSTLVSEQGVFTRNNISYIYYKSKYAIKGKFDNYSNLVEGQKVKILSQECNSVGLMTFKYSKPIEEDVFYHYSPPNETTFGDQPQLADEVSVENVEVKPSKVHGNGVFSTKDIEEGKVIIQYGGFRSDNGNYMLPRNVIQKPYNAYRHYIGFGPGVVDIPKGFEDTLLYNGTLGHIVNHSFHANVIASYVRFCLFFSKLQSIHISYC